VFANIEAVLEAHGLTLNNIVKTTVFLKSMADFAAFNAVYDTLLCGWKPARSVVEVARLPKNALVEIETIACR
jgi:2-iminobutanoate/2-iminopropanoate deaminase